MFSKKQIKRYRSVLWLLLRHGKTLLNKPPELELDVLIDNTELSDSESAEALARELEELGSTFIKLGQALSVRIDLLPQCYLDALSKLQDDVKPVAFEDITSILEQEFGTYYQNLFKELSPTPLACASLGQVHTALLNDGREVVIKIQRPGVREQVIADLDGLLLAAEFLESYIDTAERIGILQMLEEFRRSLLLELDYNQEAQNLESMDVCLSKYESIIIPKAIKDLSSSTVLTMEMINGVKVTSLTGYKRLGKPTDELAKDLYKSYLDQILIHGFVHGDPHPGNIFITEDDKIALLDLGMVAHIDPARRMSLLKLLLAINEGRGEEAAELGLAMNTPLPDYDRERMMRQTAALVAQTRRPVGVYRKTGRVILELARIAMENHVRPAPELVLLGRTFLYLDQIIEELSPGFNPIPVMEKHIFRILKRQARQRLKSGRILATALEMQDLMAELPKRANKIIEQLSQNSFQIRIDAIDQPSLLNSIEKVANRITVGLVLAALIVGAALLMNIESTWTIFGYPLLALVLFLGAAMLGLFLVIGILFNKE